MSNSSLNSTPRSAAELLDRLVGDWDLTGQMGETALHQMVEARWILGGLFVQMYFKSLLMPAPGRRLYEALYHIGYNEAEQKYVLHLLDTFGVATSCGVGVGQRAGDSIPFVFHYDSGPFTNRFTWESTTQTWTMTQTYLEAGIEKVFATKRLTRG